MLEGAGPEEMVQIFAHVGCHPPVFSLSGHWRPRRVAEMPSTDPRRMGGKRPAGGKGALPPATWTFRLSPAGDSSWRPF